MLGVGIGGPDIRDRFVYLDDDAAEGPAFNEAVDEPLDLRVGFESFVDGGDCHCSIPGFVRASIPPWSSKRFLLAVSTFCDKKDGPAAAASRVDGP